MKSAKNKLNIGVLIAIFVAIFVANQFFNQDEKTSKHGNIKSAIEQTSQENRANQSEAQQRSEGASTIQNAYDQQLNDVQVQAAGTVVAVLPDDNKGSRHQRFILDIGNAQTVLIAHNIDLAPRIENLEKGDIVEFFGEYEYNEKGGVIHWTHHDPQGQHVGGWLKHHGQTYE